MHRQWRVVGFALILGACSGGAGEGGAAGGAAVEAATPDPATVRAAIDEAYRKGVEGMNAGTFEPMLANYADDAIVMMPGMPAMRGRAAIGAGMNGMLEQFDIKDFMAKTEDVAIGGDLAVETGVITAQMGPKGGALAADTLKYITVWKKQGDGSWKIVRDINNSDIAPTM